MKPDWILVASAGEARLLAHEPGSPMVTLRSFHHPQSRLHSSELGDDERGRQRSDRVHGAAAFEAHVEPHRKEQLHFAHELAVALEEGVKAGRCAHVHLVAAEPFLGLLKAALDESTRRSLAGTHEHNFTALGLAEIEHRVLPLVGRGPRL